MRSAGRRFFWKTALHVCADGVMNVLTRHAPQGEQQMKFYTIEKDTNNIAVHASVKEAQAVAGAERFSSETALTKVAAAWPQMARKPSVFLLLRGPVFRGVAWGASGPASRSHPFSASEHCKFNRLGQFFIKRSVICRGPAQKQALVTNLSSRIRCERLAVSTFCPPGGPPLGPAAIGHAVRLQAHFLTK